MQLSDEVSYNARTAAQDLMRKWAIAGGILSRRSLFHGIPLFLKRNQMKLYNKSNEKKRTRG